MTATFVAETTIPGNHWQWRGHSIYYVKAGTRKSEHPPLLLVHGFGASTDHWRKNITQLQQDFEVWAIDLLGFGRSDKPKTVFSGKLWRDQLYDFITEVIDAPVVIAGNSLGGYASLCVASQCPTAVKGLVLLNSAGSFTETEPAPQPSPIKQFINKATRSILLHPIPSFFFFQYLRRPGVIRKTLEKVYLDQSAVTDRLVEEIYRPSCDPGAAQVFASVFKSPQGEKNDVLLSQLQCPLLMLWGEGDPWMNIEERSHNFRKYYPQLTEHYLNAGHCPHDEVPEQVNDLLRSWIVSIL